MPTQQNTSSSNQSNLQFNPTAQSMYDALISGGGGVLNQYIKSPLSNATYNLGLGQSMKGASQGAQNNMQALQSLFKTSGMGGTAGQGFMGAQNAQMGRANQSMLSGANLSNIQAALSRQMAATGMGMSFSPQLTGQSGTSNTTQTTSGLGTWLPQLLGTAAGMGIGAMTGGMSPMSSGGGGGGGFSGFTGASTFPNGSPFTGFLPPGTGSGSNLNPFSAMMMQGSN